MVPNIGDAGIVVVGVDPPKSVDTCVLEAIPQDGIETGVLKAAPPKSEETDVVGVLLEASLFKIGVPVRPITMFAGETVVTDPVLIVEDVWFGLPNKKIFAPVLQVDEATVVAKTEVKDVWTSLNN